MDTVANRLVDQFDRMVSRDGGAITILSVDDDVIRVAYRPGVDPTCDDGSCTLPGIELQQMMNETLARRHPGGRVIVEAVR